MVTSVDQNLGFEAARTEFPLNDEGSGWVRSYLLAAGLSCGPDDIELAQRKLLIPEV